jgi:rhamnosyltransferase
MKVSIICPLYNAEKYLVELHKKIRQQDIELEVEELYVLTESNDLTEDLLKKNELKYLKISKVEFSHSRTREMMSYMASGDVIVFISQDVIIKNDNWLRNLVTPIFNGECDATFSRQICTNNTIEKYIRERNYPSESRIVSNSDVERLGLRAFFFSDASSAVKSNVFRELGAYDNKNLIINEDMYFAYKLITSGYSIKYCADSEVYHSHIFTLRQLFNRYFDTGVFLRENSYLLKYGANGSGFDLLAYVVKASIKEVNLKVLLNVIPNFSARFIGSYLGKKYEGLSVEKKIKYSLNKKYWQIKEESVF